MSKQNNLTDFLTDVANAIRAKKGSTDLINPQNFSAEIAALSGGLEVIEMTVTTATIEPNKVYVWGMVESLDITLGASTDGNDFFAFRFRCSKPTMTVVTVNGATWADDTELDAQGKPILDLGSWYQCEIKGGTSALYARLAHYIHFADSNVESVLLSKGIGDGLGITYKAAAKVSSISTWFKGNADITAFAEFINFLGITKLIQDAFYGCNALAEIAFPASLTSIGVSAFRGCFSLTRVLNLENTKVISIGEKTFYECSSLAEIALPASLTSIGLAAFVRCTSLAEIALPASLTSIRGYAFNGCTSLAEIAFPASLTSIGEYAFQDCTSLAEITLPASLTSIEGYAFSNCSSLARVLNLENTKVTSIGEKTFYECSSLAEITLPASLASIGSSAFRNCTLLTEITLPDTMTSIGGGAFQGCSSLTRVMNLENTKVTVIGDYAFYGCTLLTEITLPASLTSIGSETFNGCKSLQYIRIEATTPPTLASKYSFPSTIGAIYVPDESVAAYQAATNWSNFASKIKGISEMPAK